MSDDDFVNAFESAVAADEAGTGETATDDIGRNATVLTGDQDFTETDDSTIGGESGVDDTTTDATVSQETAKQTFDWSEHKDKLVSVTVNGEVLEIPLAEAMGGFMRQSDYTRKTQSLADERSMAAWGREFQSAIKNDPQGTIKALQDALGFETSAETDIYGDLDPEVAVQLRSQQAQINQFQRTMERQQQNQVLEQVKAEIASVKAKYSDFDEHKVLAIAASRGLPILDAYKLSKADDFLNAETQRASVAATAAAKVEVESRKRDAAARVSQGGSVTGEASVAAKTRGMSFGELLEFNLERQSA